MDEIYCVFCEEEIIFEFGQLLVRISIEHEEDGASVVKKYWAHQDCLPEELQDA